MLPGVALLRGEGVCDGVVGAGDAGTEEGGSSTMAAHTPQRTRVWPEGIRSTVEQLPQRACW